MAADVKSIAALGDWRTDLANFRHDGMEAVSALHLQVQNAIGWLDDMEATWKRRQRAAEEDLVQAKAELSRREMPDFAGKIPDTTLQERQVRRCRARVEYCADQMDLCRSWRTRLPRMVGEEYEGPARRFTNFLDGDLVRGIAVLDRQVAALEAYAAMSNAVPPEPAAKPEGT